MRPFQKKAKNTEGPLSLKSDKCAYLSPPQIEFLTFNF